MARSDRWTGDAGRAPGDGVSAEVETKAAELVGAYSRDDERAPRRFGSGRVLSTSDRDRIINESRNVDFPAALRGYDRSAVDRYVERVSRLITELEMSSSPEAAVRYALDEVSDETRDILQHAHQTAEEITARSRAKADDRVQQAEREGQDIREQAQRKAAETREAAAQEAAQLRELATHEAAETREAATRDAQQLRALAKREADDVRGTAQREAEEVLEHAESRARELALSAEAIWRERRRLIDDMRAVGDQLVAIGETEARRFPRFGEEGSPAAEVLRDPSVAAASPEKSNGGDPEVVSG